MAGFPTMQEPCSSAPPPPMAVVVLVVDDKKPEEDVAPFVPEPEDEPVALSPLEPEPIPEPAAEPPAPPPVVAVEEEAHVDPPHVEEPVVKPSKKARKGKAIP